MVSLASSFVASIARISRENASSQAWQRAYYNAAGKNESKAWIIREYGSVDAYLEDNYPTALFSVAKQAFKEYDSTSYTSFALIISWPWLTAVALLIFRKTTSLARLNLTHILRCSIYSFDVLFWVACAICLAIPGGYFFSMPSPGSPISILSEIGPFLIFLFCLSIASYRLSMAFRYYLKFDRPASVVIATQFIVFLAMANIFALLVLWLFPPSVG